MNEPYMSALKKAEQELVACEAEFAKWDRKRAELRHSVVVLQKLAGVDVIPEQTMTEAILLSLKAMPGMSTVPQVVDLLTQMGFKSVHIGSVATILCRLHKDGKIQSLRVSPESKQAVYGWKDETTRDERNQARKILAHKGRND